MGKTHEITGETSQVSAQSAYWRVLTKACIAQLVTVVGEYLFLSTALLIWAYNVTNSEHGVEMALVAITAPALLSLPAGAWTSRFSTRRVLAGCAVLRLLLTGLLLVAWKATGNFYLVLVCAFAICLVDSFFMPALKAALPDWVPESKLVLANSLMESTDIPAQIVGPLLAVVVYAKWGFAGAIWAQIMAYAASAVILASTAFPAVNAHTRGKASVYRDVRRILGSMRRSKLVRRVVIAWTLGMIAIGVAQALILPFIDNILHQPDSIFGVFSALLGVGMGVGAAVTSIWEIDLPDSAMLAISLGVVAASVAVLARASTLPVCYAAIVAAGAGAVLVHVSGTTVMQNASPEGHRAGGLGLIHTIEAAGLLVGVVFGTELIATLGIRNVLLGGAVLLMIGAVVSASLGFRDEEE